MSVPKTPKNFEYDLWTSSDGKHFSRLKRTGEVCEVNLETFRFLRKLEKELRRELQGTEITITSGRDNAKKKLTVTMLSLDYVTEGEELETSLLADKTDYENIVVTELMEQEFFKLLTNLQLSTYRHCIIDGMTYVEYAKLVGVHEATVRSAIKLIRKKAKKFFKHTTI